ncbi:UDP-N-acetylmuramate--L-alanine ligase [Treponema phagedenis]|uniref:UDP-N-acetylmuramate--L-alanine ligase n=1 Tax=Treponema phagedenis TaxID=162 RepID=A0AAE6M749_TREPH|nr:UDP-N-acetylmuramate--L-alanine ligase [Treponema phagedenis]EFW38776.1 UDP-N-acetylmuramate--L-alanine ligase [Treponema phagedenis F0421]NVP25248.1 UDP-N-acetylmuramate--L-alanine ligase [Treponema phagedenis]QEJ93903.1 UDP-N-acetylmuramate--L-alanine ligase [Treponema phagedenis]QEJ97079.1 UDP-N-acetylmuramate--L-alanine ligase [Treponema phagedenis]QEJ99830.1 UDP-N-acetylmuramate--L-alanine ligase [Treponema phagedenis]
MKQSGLPADVNGFKIHMIGIKGTGMSALAELLVSRGAVITGSDVADEFYTDEVLKHLQIAVTAPFSAKNIPPDTQLVIYSAAYTPEENEELHEAFMRSLPTLSYPKALGDFSRHSYSCGIAGVHGKTTTTGIVGTLVKALDLDASVLAGSMIANFGNSCTMIHGDSFFIAETCEYKKHFLNFYPKKIVLTSVESDHQDFYPQYEDILAAFLQYIDRLPQFSEIFYCADDPGAKEAINLAFSSRPDLIYIPYGESVSSEFGVKIHGVRDEKLYFSLKGFAGEFYLTVPGHHNVLNAAAAIALVLSLVKLERKETTINDITIIRKALASFKGAKRRSEIVGEAKGILFMDDYAHHPTAIKTTLKGLKEFYPNRRIIVDFMSHTYSRTAALLNEFSQAFSSADEIILHKIYASAREVYHGEVTGRQLFELTKKSCRKTYYYEEVMDAESFLEKELQSGDLFITMGAGDNWKLGRTLYEKFSK